MNPFHAAVWLDHQQAKIFHVEEDRFDESLIYAPNHQVHRDPAAAERFYHRIAESLASAGEVLVLGPGSAKLQFIKHVHSHDRPLGDRVIGVETVDHPTDKQLISYIRRYFHDNDRMKGLVP